MIFSFILEREIPVEVMFLLVRPHLFLGALFMDHDCETKTAT